MWYKTFLPHVHQIIKPSNYVEIGIRHGYSLSLSQAAKRMAIDLAFGANDMESDVENCQYFIMTSDEFFSNYDLSELLPGGYDLSYIDGLHLFEVALRDLINLERCAGKRSVIILDHVIPRNESEATREATGGSWAGAVWKIVECIAENRPELFATSLLVRSKPTGCLVLTTPDRQDNTLWQCYDEIIARFLGPGYPKMPGKLFDTYSISAETALLTLAKRLTV